MSIPDLLYARLHTRRHSILLVAIVVAFAVRPLIGDAGIGPIIFSLTMLLLLLVALLAIQVDDLMGEREALLVQRRRRTLVGWSLALAAIAERLVMLVAPGPRFLLFSSICWLAFFVFVTWSQLRAVLRQRRVTGETLSSAMSVYLLLGICWGLLYVVIFQVHPQAFSFGAAPAPGSENAFPVFIYFSLTTLSSIGFGDILPVSLQARYAAVAEGIAGQFYLAVLVARLVGLQMSQGGPLVTDKGIK